MQYRGVRAGWQLLLHCRHRDPVADPGERCCHRHPSTSFPPRHAQVPGRNISRRGASGPPLLPPDIAGPRSGLLRPHAPDQDVVHQAFPSRSARPCCQQRQADKKGERPVWQHRCWEHLLRDEEDYRRHVEYIDYNPVKHGYARGPIDWRYSSFQHYVAAGTYPADWGEPAVDLPEGIGVQ